MAKAIRDVMTTDPVSMPASATVLDAARKMREESIGAVLVLEGEQVCGILTDRDVVVRSVAAGQQPAATTLNQVCSQHLATVSPDDHLGVAVRLMRDKAVRRVPVVDHDRPVGIVSLGDLARGRDRESALGVISAAPPNV